MNRKILIINSVLCGALGIAILGYGLQRWAKSSSSQNKILAISTKNEQVWASPLPQVSPKINEAWHVVKVIDGDTVKLENGETVRYIGIDAPEKSECFATEATLENKRLVEEKSVRLQKDISEIDKYKRFLRFVFINDVFVNDYLVRQGFAKAKTYPPDIKYKDQFTQAEQEARENKRGLWGACR